MAQNTDDKLASVMTFLKGTASLAIFALLAMRGFTPEERRKGILLLGKAMGIQFDQPQGQDPAGLGPLTTKLAALDRWENAWYPVILAALKYEFPAIYDKVFLNLSQTTGMELLFSVGTLLDRVEALASGSAQEQAAFAKLESRQLSAIVRQEARDLIQQANDIPQATQQASSLPQEMEQAEEELWNWYREWAAIARTVIHRKDYLITLGLRQRPQSDPNPDPQPQPE